MARTAPTETADLLISFTDVLYLTNSGQMSPKIRRLLRQKKLTYLVLSPAGFSRITHRLDLIGTVVMDIVSSDVSTPGRLDCQRK